MQSIAIDPDALKVVYEQAQAAYPDTERGWGKAILAAYEYLMDLWADDRSALFDGQVMLVESATELGTIHRANGGCDCQAGERAAARNETAVCWHRSARQLVAKMLKQQTREEDCRYDYHYGSADLGARLATARRERVYSEMQELFA